MEERYLPRPVSWVLAKMYRNMPVDLVLVRHGQSEGNLAQRLWRQQRTRHSEGDGEQPQHSVDESASALAENVRRSRGVVSAEGFGDVSRLASPLKKIGGLRRVGGCLLL